MHFVFVGGLVFIVWAVLAWATRHDGALKTAPVRRIADIDGPGIVKLQGRVTAHGPERVAATLSGRPVLFSAFHGMVFKPQTATPAGVQLARTVGVRFGVGDGSKIEAIVVDPEHVRISGASDLEIIQWQRPDEVNGIAARLGVPLDRWTRLQGRDDTLNEGDAISVLAHAEPTPSHVLLKPVQGLGICVALGTIAELERRVRRGQRFLRGTLALAVSLIGIGLYRMLG